MQMILFNVAESFRSNVLGDDLAVGAKKFFISRIELYDNEDEVQTFYGWGLVYQKDGSVGKISTYWKM